MPDARLREELELLRELGYTHLDLDAARARQGIDATDANPRVTSVLADAAAATPEPAAAFRASGDGAALLAAMASEIADCQLCRLCKGRTQVVFGVGNPNARLMFIGEAPGRDEDIQGEPFVGKAGQLLTDIIKAMKLRREDVYIGNVAKCRPPENRNPEPDELDACRPYILRQIEIIKPEVIVTLGKVALKGLFEREFPITRIRGEWMNFQGIKLMPTYHPAYLLRTPTAKKDVWADMKQVMVALGIPA
jgi:uracil-DNA glycosylase